MIAAIIISFILGGLSGISLMCCVTAYKLKILNDKYKLEVQVNEYYKEKLEGELRTKWK